jgi:para-aminobenzoate synthetase component 1
MIELSRRILLDQLSNLQVDHLAIQTVGPTPQDLIIFFDFKDSFSPESFNDKKIWGKFQNFSQSTGLSFSGWVGFFGYEFLGYQFGVPLQAHRDLDVPPAWFGRPHTIIRLQDKNTIIESTDGAREREVKTLLEKSLASRPIIKPQELPTCNLNFEEYEGIFNRAKEAILEGETYQIKISQRFEAPTELDPLRAFIKLQKSNPAPEAFILQTPTFSIVSCSPETIIQKKDQTVTTRPIGGTYRRNDSRLDSSVIEKFLQDPKEIAEHNMLVDLERNDLSTICEPGTVRIKNFRQVESYSHLHHLVSTITGRLRRKIDLEGIVQAMLPGGSITGCPKVRTMQWIDRLEPCFRGPYTGSFGSIADNGDIRLNLIIRAMLILGDHCYTQAGGGIVVNSTPEYEFKENRTKAQALLDLLK